MATGGDKANGDTRLLTLDDAIASMEPLRRGLPDDPVLHQFWDQNPPKQIQKLLRHNAKLCRRWGIRHVIWDQRSAERYLADHYADLLPLFKRSPHPAMASDLFRLCVMYREGGLYLDADMALRARGGERLAPLLHEGLVFKWSLEDRMNLPNWCFGFRKGHPIVARLVTETSKSMQTALDQDPQKALKTILSVSGPGLFTRVVGSWIAEQGCPPGMLVLDVSDAYKMVQNGPQLLRTPLHYKKTALHWLQAGKEAG